MACSSFEECTPENPLSEVAPGAYHTFYTLQDVLHFTANFVIYLIYGALVVFVAYYLFRTVYTLLFADPEEKTTYEKFREGLQAAALAAVGLLLISSLNFIITSILTLFGADTSILSF